MTQTASVWLVLVTAAIAANLPFMTQRLLAVWPLPNGKGLAVRLGELVVLYFLVGILGLALEGQSGQIVAQGGEFYAVTGALFVTLAFPGFVYRYLLKHRH